MLLGNGDGTFAPQVTYAVGSDPGAIVAGDWSGETDLVVSDGDGIQILLGNGDGTFQRARTIAPGIGGVWWRVISPAVGRSIWPSLVVATTARSGC